MVSETTFLYRAELAHKVKLRGRISGINPLAVLTNLVDSLIDQFPEEVDLFTVSTNGPKMTARYFGSQKATIRAAPDGNWEWRSEDLYVNGKLVPKQGPKYELVGS